MATLTPVTPAATGTTLTMAAVGASDKFANPRGNAIAIITNGSGSSINATFTARTTTRPASGQFEAQTVSDKVVAIANGATKMIPVTTAYNDSDGNVTVTCSATSSVTIAILQPAG